MDFLQDRLPEYAKKYSTQIHIAIAFVAIIISMAPLRSVQFLIHTVRTAMGVAIGVGLGLGLALHVYEQLQHWQQNNARQQEQSLHSYSSHPNQATPTKGIDRSQSDGIRNKTSSLLRSHSDILEDGTSYFSLMSLAGYHHNEEKVLRGQVVREDSKFWKRNYAFTDVVVDEQLGPKTLTEEWPGLPTPVARELGRFVEHIIRDFIGGWYSRLDKGCLWSDEKEKRKQGIGRDGTVIPTEGGLASNSITSQATASTAPTSEDRMGSSNTGSSTGAKKGRTRKMVFSTLGYRRIPMMDQCYRVLCIAFGSLASRAEHVNILSLVLLKWTQVLAHTLKVYRQLRKVVEEKTGNTQPSEVEITREFLLAGKLHKAVTFGLDVPSLLFADPEGKECGTGTDVTADTALRVLEERLFGTTLLKECELDYNRVVSSRLLRALLPKSDSASNVVMAMVVEIFSACVLQPVMNLWTPAFLNEIIVNSLSAKPGDDTTVPEPERATQPPSSQTSVALSEQGAESSAAADVSYVATKARTDSASSVTSDLTRWGDETVTGGIEDEGAEPMQRQLEYKKTAGKGFGQCLVAITSLSLSRLKGFADFDALRRNAMTTLEARAIFEDSKCQDAVKLLVMIVEASLLEGRVVPRLPPQSPDSSARAESSGSISYILMELTSNMKAFRTKLSHQGQLVEENEESTGSPNVATIPLVSFNPDQDEISTIRTLIATWLQTGQLVTALSLIKDATRSILKPFFRPTAFLLSAESIVFVKQFSVLSGIGVIVETMGVLSSPKLQVEMAYVQLFQPSNDDGGLQDAGIQSTASSRPGTEDNLTILSSDLMTHTFGNTVTPRHLDFHKNGAFATSLREERDRRIRSWASQPSDETLQVIVHKGASRPDLDLQNELHGLARIFYNSTNILSIRDAAKKSEEQKPNSSHDGTTESGKVSLITVETVSARRKLEVPDDDSSFLLRAQPRSLNPVSVHRDDRNHDLSYRCYLCTYEEPVATAGMNRHTSGRYIRRCFLQYYPIDRTATIMLYNDSRKVDRRKGRPMSQDQLSQQQHTPSCLSGSFLRERHLCMKSLSKSAAAQSFLSSSVMEATDFNASPRSGKALDFIYKVSLFERPVIDLASKLFTVHDSSARGHHRSDASALEMSDASLSALLLGVGREYGDKGLMKAPRSDNVVEMGPDGYPMVFVRYQRKQNDQTVTEIKPYRLSFVRAALLVTSTRQEAQLQCLLDCVRNGSAKNATKAKTELLLRPTLKILEYANDASSDKIRASKLLRDLKLGVYHIDRGQLRRNGLLNPRSPTSLLELSAKVETGIQAKEVPDVAGIYRLQPSAILYRIRCRAVVSFSNDSNDSSTFDSYLCEDGRLSSAYIEEWTIYRSMKDFQVFHKHIKSQVASTESSASTGSRLVGAATAAFTTSYQDRRTRKALVPSMAQASKTGAIAATQKTISKRGELLGEYLGELLAQGHALNRCTELLLFLGASFPFPQDVRVSNVPMRVADPLGRSHFVRVAHRIVQPATPYEESTEQQRRESVTSERHNGEENEHENPAEFEMIAGILNKVDQVPLSEVRNRLVELVKYQFGFENASFFRSKILSALETASFVAMAQASEFRKLLYKIHSEQLSADAVAGLIEKVMGILWPDGCWMTPRELLTPEEEQELKEESRKILHQTFPEQLQTILGRELTMDGLDIVHEMLQNRVVVKSLFYMLFDLVWIEIFPEIRDGMDCASALDIEKNE